MQRVPPLRTLWQRHADEERDCVRRALVAAGWRLTVAAGVLQIRVSTLQGVLKRHPALLAERDRERPDRPGGRPRLWPSP
jgi:transcriptional regulator with GAF, ATPase, and Fis domain